MIETNEEIKVVKPKKKKDSDVWRPTVMTQDVVNKLEEGFAMWMTDIEACLYANISKPSLYKYCEKNTEFTDRKETLKNNLKMIAKTNLNKSIKDWDMLDTKWYLERKAKDEFSLRTEVEQNSTVDMKVEVSALDTLNNLIK